MRGWARSIGRLHDSEGLLLYSYPDLPEVPPGETRSTVRERVDMRDRDERMLHERAAELETVLGSRPEVRVADGYPANILLEASQEEWPSLVVVGSRGLAGIMRTRLGSASTKVVTASRGPRLPARGVGAQTTVNTATRKAR